MHPPTLRSLSSSLLAALCLGLFALCLTVMGCSHAGDTAHAAEPGQAPEGPVRIHVYNQDAELVGPLPAEPVDLSPAEWRKRLTDHEYHILREAGTERPGTGDLLDNKKKGVYTCAACDVPLFHSDTKFESGTGWPSFYQPIAAENMLDRRDLSYGMVRTENICARCHSHLGHVFRDGPPPTGKRYCINAAALNFTPQDQLTSLAEPETIAAADQAEAPATQPAAATQPANPDDEAAKADGEPRAIVLAGGCFWCTEAVFEQLRGVKSVVSGYAGGKHENASYNAVASGQTEHAEVIKVTYDPDVVNFQTLLEVFFTVAHDPTQLNRQGPDVGPQYRSAFFYETPEQKRFVEVYIDRLEDSGRYSKDIVTTLEPLERFYPAESYHQDFVQKNPRHPYVRAHAVPKLKKLRKQHQDLAQDKN